MAEKKEVVMEEVKNEAKKLSIHEKLFMVQQQLVAPKNQYNSFGKYKYRSCEDIFEGLKPVLSIVKAIVKVSDDIQLIGDRFYLKATAEFIDVESGEIVSNVAFAREEENKKGMDSSQVTGATSSYARKYALNGLFGIDDTKEADSMDNSRKEKTDTSTNIKVGQPKLITPEQIATLTDLINRKGFTVEKTYLQGIENVTIERYQSDIAKLSKLPDKKKE